MSYEFRTADGRICCRASQIKHLCPRCLERAIAKGVAAAQHANNAVPPPPSLVARVLAGRTDTPMIVVRTPTPPTVMSVRPASRGMAPQPPSLVARIQEGARR